MEREVRWQAEAATEGTNSSGGGEIPQIRETDQIVPAMDGFDGILNPPKQPNLSQTFAKSQISLFGCGSQCLLSSTNSCERRHWRRLGPVWALSTEAVGLSVAERTLPNPLPDGLADRCAKDRLIRSKLKSKENE